MRLLTKLFPKKKPEWAALCSVVYKDKSGREYYKFNDEMDMPLLRKHEIDKCLMELRFGSDLNDVVSAMDQALNRVNKKGRSQPDIKGIGYLVQEIKERREYLFDSKTLFEICALSLIREDENAYKPDQDITREKVEVFTAEIERRGLYFFLIKSGLLKSLTQSSISINQFYQLMSSSERQMQASRAVIDHISGQQSASMI